MASIFSVFTSRGRLPAPMRANLEPEGIVRTAERVHVSSRFSGSIPGAVNKVDPRFHGDFSLEFKTALTDDVLGALPVRSLAFDVAPEYVFHMLGVRVK